MIKGLIREQCGGKTRWGIRCRLRERGEEEKVFNEDIFGGSAFDR